MIPSIAWLVVLLRHILALIHDSVLIARNRTHGGVVLSAILRLCNRPLHHIATRLVCGLGDRPVSSVIFFSLSSFRNISRFVIATINPFRLRDRLQYGVLLFDGARFDDRSGDGVSLLLHACLENGALGHNFLILVDRSQAVSLNVLAFVDNLRPHLVDRSTDLSESFGGSQCRLQAASQTDQCQESQLSHFVFPAGREFTAGILHIVQSHP